MHAANLSVILIQFSIFSYLHFLLLLSHFLCHSIHLLALLPCFFSPHYFLPPSRFFPFPRARTPPRLVRVPPLHPMASSRHHHHHHLLFLLLCFSLFSVDFSSALSDPEALLAFKSSLKDETHALSSWKNNSSPCNGEVANWVGVLCNAGVVWGVQLEDKGLSGTINVEALKDLDNLRTLSFMHNKFEGALPEINKLGVLKSLYLSGNQFSGEIPADAFKGMLSLKKLHLAQNGFTGSIPASLGSLPKLIELRLEENQFTGAIPEFEHPLQDVNMSQNALTGPIPASLTNIKPDSFQGNKDLCGQPLDACATPPIPVTTISQPSQQSQQSQPAAVTIKKVPTSGIVVMAIVAGAAMLVIILAVLMARRKRQARADSIEAPTPSNLQKKSGIKDSDQASQASSDVSGSVGKKTDGTKLSFVRDDREKFDLPDLLKASAEILGSGCFGSSYKAALVTGPIMVVKRFKQMNNVGREEFQEHMRRIGRLRHANLLPLVAYYYRKEEKLLVTDYVERGSLAVHLHGHQALGQPSLDWSTRLKIVKGVARALQYIYKELPSLIAPHGHIKSSNILLSQNSEPLLTDYGLIPVINQESSQEFMVAYKSPEYKQHGRITKKTDVWGLGILILEILTGKFPANFIQKGKGNEEDLAAWVNSVFTGEFSREVFDEEMEAAKNSEGEILKLLKIALACCDSDVEKRMDLKEAIEKIEELKEKEGEEDFYSSYASEADVKSSRGVSDDFTFS